jgi:hypothetical protein
MHLGHRFHVDTVEALAEKMIMASGGTFDDMRRHRVELTQTIAAGTVPPILDEFLKLYPRPESSNTPPT